MVTINSLNASYPQCSTLDEVARASPLGQERVLFQTHPLPALLSGRYSNGGVSVTEILQHGNFGLGTFNDFHGGEMLVYGGRAYTLPAPGEIRSVGEAQTETPFAMVTSFQQERSVYLRDIPSYQAFQEEFQHCLTPKPAKHYAVFIQGRFNHLSVQCVQEPRASGVPFSQVEQQRAGVSGVDAVLVGFRMAASVDPQVNKPGFHFHGMTEDSSLGGHILDFGIEQAIVSVMEIDRFAHEPLPG